MKLGAENRTKTIAAIALGVVAVLFFAYEVSGWFGGSSNAAAPSASVQNANADDPIPAPRVSKSRSPAGKKSSAAESSLDPSLKLDLLAGSEGTKYEGTGRNIFKVFVPPPPAPIVNPVLDHRNEASTPAPPPPPPPIPLTFYGFATPSGGSKRIFLAHGEDIFVAKEGEIVDRRYKVVRISPNAVEILDVLSNNRQSIPLTQG